MSAPHQRSLTMVERAPEGEISPHCTKCVPALADYKHDLHNSDDHDDWLRRSRKRAERDGARKR